MTCCNRNRFISSTAVTVSGTQVVIQIPDNTFNDGDTICLLIAQDIPSSSSANTVTIQIGSSGTAYPMTKVCGDNVRADQIRRNTIYRLYVGTAPGHFMIRNSKCLPCTNFVAPQINATTTTTTTVSNFSTF